MAVGVVKDFAVDQQNAVGDLMNGAGRHIAAPVDADEPVPKGVREGMDVAAGGVDLPVAGMDFPVPPGGAHVEHGVHREGDLLSSGNDGKCPDVLHNIPS